MNPTAPARWSAARAAAILVPLFLFFANAGGTLPTFSLPNEALPVQQARSVYLEGSWSLDRQFAVWGGFGIEDTVKRDGASYPNKPPGATLWLLLWMPLLDALKPGAPGFFYVSYAGRVLALTLPFVIWLYFFGRRLEREAPPAAAWGIVLALALGTNAGVYATLYYAHVPALVAHGTALLLIWRERPRAFAAGLLSGAGVLFENSTVFASLALAWILIAGQNARLVPLFFAGMIPAGAVQAFYQWKVFGSPWTLPQTPMHRPSDGSPPQAIGLWNPRAMLALAAGMPRGIFFHSPWIPAGFAAAAAALPRLAKERRLFAAGALALLAVQILFISSYSEWHGDWSVGPRYLIACYPFLAAACALGLGALEPTARRVFGMIVALAASVSIAYQLFFLASVPYHPEHEGFFYNYAREIAIPFLRQCGVYTAADWLGTGFWTARAIFFTLWLAPLAAYLSFAGEDRARRKALFRIAAAALCVSAVWAWAGKSEPAASEKDLYEVMRRNWHGR